MKSILIIFTVLLLSCSSTKSILERTPNKKYVGKVVTVTHMNQGCGIKSTFVQTDSSDFFIWEKLKLKVGTDCYFYPNPSGTKIYVIWENCKNSREIR